MVCLSRGVDDERQCRVCSERRGIANPMPNGRKKTIRDGGHGESERSPGLLYPRLSNQPSLDALGQQDVAEQRQREQRPVERWQRSKPKPGPNRREGEPNADCHDDCGRNHQRQTGPALEERDPVRANDMDNQRLGQQGFNKPTRLERAGAGLLGSQQWKTYSMIRYVV